MVLQEDLKRRDYQRRDLQRRISMGLREEHDHSLGWRPRVAGDDIERDADEDELVRVSGRAAKIERRIGQWSWSNLYPELLRSRLVRHGVP